MSKKVVMSTNFLKSHTHRGGVLEIDRLPILDTVVWRTSESVVGMRKRVGRRRQCSK